MPFDGTDFDTIPAKPDAAFLSRALRDGPDGKHWPAGFVWDFCENGTCGIGLAALLWPSLGPVSSFSAWDTAIALTGNADDGFNVFGGGLSASLNLHNRDVTPHHVAYALDVAIATRAAA